MPAGSVRPPYGSSTIARTSSSARSTDSSGLRSSRNGYGNGACTTSGNSGAYGFLNFLFDVILIAPVVAPW